MRFQLISLTVAAVVALAPSTSRAEDKKKEGLNYAHTVIFYLTAEAPAGTADAILADCHEMLAKIPTVRVLKAGRPIASAGVPTKKDFAVGLTILFDDEDGFKTYATHPLHLQFVAKYRKYFDVSKIAIYDFVNAKK